MSRRPPIVLTAAVTAALLACGSAAVALPASAATRTAPLTGPSGSAAPAAPAPATNTVPTPTDDTVTPTPGDTPVDLTVVLRPSDEEALRTLPGRAAGASTAARQQAVDEVAPAAEHGALARAALAAAGFTVTDADTWELEATGTAAQASAFFGVQLLGVGDGMHPTTEPPLPAAFGDSVVSVLGLDTRPVAAHAGLPGGTTPAQLASAYRASTAATAGAGTTVATVQFSGWDRTDLTTYALATGRPLPAVQQVAVDGASARTFDGHGGETEVALDQEALLATAPAARQRIYVAPNSNVGMYDAYSAIADDVATHGITAVSISWGMCESLMGSGERTVLENAVDRIVAAGATVFAASGDSGVSCPTGPDTAVRSVSYPASSPAVVGVGGTSLTRSGSGWTERGWSNGYGATGGGVSAFAKPSWQTGTGVTGTKRLVPDIAAVADPGTGPAIYMGSAGGWVLGGGTSLASPVVAGHFAAMLSARGCTLGIGDVHQALYANPGALRDVTTGSNGTTPAGVGFDTATGLGSPDWTALARVLPTAAGCGTQGAVRKVDGTRLAASTTPLDGGSAIHSPNGQYWLELQSDGDLVEYGNNRKMWATHTAVPGSTVRLVPGSTFAVVAPSGAVVWDSRVVVPAGAALTLTDRGDVALVSGTRTLWHNRAPHADTLAPGGRLSGGHSVWDASGKNRFVVRADGAAAVYLDGKLRWIKRSGADGVLSLQSNGELVLRDQYGTVRWRSGTTGKGSVLSVRTDGDVRITQGKKTLWRTGTHV